MVGWDISKQLITKKINQHMKTTQADKIDDKTKKTGEVRMGRVVTSKKASDGNSKTSAKNEKEELREDRASSLV